MKGHLLIVATLCYIAAMFVLLHGWAVGVLMFAAVLFVIGLLLLGLRPSQWRSQWWLVRGSSE